MTPTKARRVQKGNPRQLTIRQHVLPRRSIARFAGEDKKVEVRRHNQAVTIRLEDDNPMFCASRAWDQRAESGYSRSIEIEFQSLADSIVAGKTTLDEGDHIVVSRFWALWRLRAEVRASPTPPLRLNGVIESREFSVAEQDALEAKHVVYVENGSQVPSHIWVRLKMQVQIGRLTCTPIRWGLIHSPDSEFIVPSRVGTSGFVPLTPHVALLANQPEGTITKEQTVRLNKALLSFAGDYVFARKISRALDETAT